jgi:MFS family permease
MAEAVPASARERAQLPDDTAVAGAGYRRYALGLLVLVSVVNAIDRSVLVALLEPIKAELALNDLQLGLISGVAFSMFYATLGIPFARWADLGNRRRLLSLTVGFWSLMTALSGLAVNFTQMFLARVGVGVGEAGGNPAALSLLAELYTVRRGGIAISLFLCGGAVGTVVGLWGGAAIATHYGWRLAFIVMGLPGLVLALTLGLTLREPRTGCRLPTLSETFGPEFLGVARGLFAKPSFLYCVIAFAVFGVFGMGSGQWIISYIVRNFDITLDKAGAYFSVAVGVSTLAGTFLGGPIANLIGARDVRGYLLFPALIGLLCTPLYGVVFTTGSLTVVIVLSAVAGLLTGLMTPCVFAVVFGIAGARHRATGLALLGVFASLVGGGLGPLIIGAASDLLQPAFGQQSLAVALLGSVGFMTAASGLFYLASRTLLADFEADDAS